MFSEKSILKQAKFQPKQAPRYKGSETKRQNKHGSIGERI